MAIFKSDSIPIFTFAPPPDIYSNMNLYVSGSISGTAPTQLVARPIDWLLYSPDHNPQIIGTLGTVATSCNIRVWDITDGINTALDLVSSSCYAIGDTGRWGWSTANLPAALGHRKHLFYRMISDKGPSFEGQFLFDVAEHAKWMHPSDRSDYILGGG